MSNTAEIEIRELDRRSNDGIVVRLLWSPESDRVWIDVQDERSGGSFKLEVAPGDALAAFRHPYAFAKREDADDAVAA
ncbi:MAG TPA: hypothetical protein VMP89_12740 [Solirubrobacteraceae bacterium]|nr:hypothetical protein [Solirubrobacteraceae bacterium]